MKTTFSCFPGMFENPASAKYYFKITRSKIFWNINYIRTRRKIIDDYCLEYKNDLFRIKLIILRSSSMLQLSEFVWTLRSSVKVVYIKFLLIDATDRNKISSNHHR